MIKHEIYRWYLQSHVSIPDAHLLLPALIYDNDFRVNHLDQRPLQLPTIDL